MQSLPKGTNVRLLFQRCACEDTLLASPEPAVTPIRKAIRDSGLEDLSDTHHAFENGGYTLAIILAESHIIVHTWPELDRMALIEISICDFTQPNQEKAIELGERMARLYQPAARLREISTMIPRLLKTPLPGHGHYVEVDSLLKTRENAIQTISLVETVSYGRAVAIDGLIQTCENDDFFYNEPLVHVPMLSHPSPRNVLVCGGGDGSAAKEILKHPCVETCVIADYDPDVIDLAKTELTAIHRGALNDSRVQVHVSDAKTFLENTDSRFDIILMDTSDPSSRSDLSFSPEFYSEIHECLNENGCFCFHFGSPFAIEEAAVRRVCEIRDRFESSHLFSHFVPSCGTMAGFAICFKTSQPLISKKELSERYAERGLNDLQIVTPETFHALFLIPPWLKKIFPKN